MIPEDGSYEQLKACVEDEGACLPVPGARYLLMLQFRNTGWDVTVLEVDHARVWYAFKVNSSGTMEENVVTIATWLKAAREGSIKRV